MSPNGDLSDQVRRGKIETVEKSRLHFDDGKGNTVKIVYRKDDIQTHAFRFAKEDEKQDENAENELKSG